MAFRFLFRSLLLFATFSHCLHADDSIAQIETKWKDHFGDANRQGEYHYRCRIDRHVVDDTALRDGITKPESSQWEIEIARHGESYAIHLIRNVEKTDWREIYDGVAKYVSQSETDWSIYTSRHLMHRASDRTILTDPLSDVLGLGLSSQLPSWTLGADWPHISFSLSDALFAGEYAIKRQNAGEVELVAPSGDEVTLSKRYGYGISQRKWTLYAPQPLTFRLENKEWLESANGVWRSAESTLTCTIEPEGTLVYRTLFSFTPQQPVSESFFEITVDTPGTNIYFSNGFFEDGNGDHRIRRLEDGEIIDLTGVAHGTHSVRWDSRQWPAFSFLQVWNLTPIVVFGALLFVQSFSNGRVFAVKQTRRLLRLSAILCIAFLLLIHLSMTIYGAGTSDSPETVGYSMTRDFLSNLGRINLPNGDHNTPSSVMFCAAITIAGISLASYMFTLPGLFTNRLSRRLAFVAAFFGLASAWFFVRVGWTPIDWHFEAHQRFATSGFALIGLASAAYAAALLLQNDYPKKYAGSLLLLFCLTVVELGLRNVDDGRDFLGTDWMARQVLSQKLLFYAISATMLFQLCGARRWLASQACEDAQRDHAAVARPEIEPGTSG